MGVVISKNADFNAINVAFTRLHSSGVSKDYRNSSARCGQLVSLQADLSRVVKRDIVTRSVACRYARLLAYVIAYRKAYYANTIQSTISTQSVPIRLHHTRHCFSMVVRQSTGFHGGYMLLGSSESHKLPIPLLPRRNTLCELFTQQEPRYSRSIITMHA